MKETYPNLISEKYLKLSSKEIFHERITDRNFFTNILRNKDMKDLFDETYSNMYREGANEILYNAPPVPAMERLIGTLSGKMAQTAGASDLCHLLARDSKEFAILKSRFPTTTVIDASGSEVFKTDAYARIIMSDASHIERFDTTFTLMAVLAYPENVEVIDGKKAIADRNAIARIHFTNSFELIDPILRR